MHESDVAVECRTIAGRAGKAVAADTFMRWRDGKLVYVSDKAVRPFGDP